MHEGIEAPVCHDGFVVLAERTLFDIRAGEWAALGVWATIIVYLVLAAVAIRQLKEAQVLREEQSRPVVLVDVVFRSILMDLSIRNVGPTVASNVFVTFDEPPATKAMANIDWLSSTTFTQGIPMMAPGREIRFHFDTYPARHGSGLPMVITGRVCYSGFHGKREWDEAFIIDLTNFERSSRPEKGVHDLVQEVAELRQELNKWTDGMRGIRVSVTDKDRENAREMRTHHLKQSRNAIASDGWAAGARYWFDHWLKVFGWRDWRR